MRMIPAVSARDCEALLQPRGCLSVGGLSSLSFPPAESGRRCGEVI